MTPMCKDHSALSNTLRYLEVRPQGKGPVFGVAPELPNCADDATRRVFSAICGKRTITQQVQSVQQHACIATDTFERHGKAEGQNERPELAAGVHLMTGTSTPLLLLLSGVQIQTCTNRCTYEMQISRLLIWWGRRAWAVFAFRPSGLHVRTYL